MSLIEQAAKRLAELKRAGVDAPSQDPPASAHRAAQPADARVPTPEAIVREARLAQGSLLRVPTVPSDAASDAAVAAGAAAPALEPRNGVEFDYARLDRLGLVTPDHLDSQIAHELRVLKRPILRNAAQQAGKSNVNAMRVMVTSALPGEGKTFTAANLALSMAMEVDNAVLLVDGDVAHPALLQLLGVPQSPGLLDLLGDADYELEDVVLRTNLDRLMLLPAGSRNLRATELIASDRMTQLLDTLTARLPGHIIVFDSPPLLPTAESRVLATHAGQVVMVVAAESTSRAAVEQALATIERCECVMMLLNKAVSSGGASYYGY
ncbi:MAG: XrtA-associated tyrosine autokinase [Burkholderiales bacterium]